MLRKKTVGQYSRLRTSPKTLWTVWERDAKPDEVNWSRISGADNSVLARLIISRIASVRPSLAALSASYSGFRRKGERTAIKGQEWTFAIGQEDN